MTPPMDDATVKRVVDELANALQTAVLITTRLQARRGEDADDTATLQGALQRATATLQRLQPR